MKKSLFIIPLTATLLLAACKTPEYGADLKENEEPYIEPLATEILTLNGYVAEVTEDNIIRIRVPRAGDLIQDGLQVNAEGLVDVALASIELPINDMPFASETTELLSETLEGQEVTVEVTELLQTNELEIADLAKGYVYREDEEKSIQSMLITNGLALIDTSEPFIETVVAEYGKLQTAAQEDKLGVWAIDGLIKTSKQMESYFTEIGYYNEEQAQQVVEELKKRGWTVDGLMEQLKK